MLQVVVLITQSKKYHSRGQQALYHVRERIGDYRPGARRIWIEQNGRLARSVNGPSAAPEDENQAHGPPVGSYET
jgi:hypothetical protein